MSNLERYLDKIFDPKEKISDLEPIGKGSLAKSGSDEKGEEDTPTPSPLIGVIRRWYLVLFVFILVGMPGSLGVWHLVEPGYVVESYIRIKPAVEDILTGNQERGEVASYGQFVQTQAMIISSEGVFQRVVDELADRNLDFFEDRATTKFGSLLQKLQLGRVELRPTERIRQAFSSGVISASPLRGTEFLRVTMKSMNPQEARIIVDSIVRNYLARYNTGTHEFESQTIEVLEDERKNLLASMQSKMTEIREKASEYGTTELGARQNTMFENVASLMGRIIELEAQAIAFETQIQVLEAVGLPDPSSLAATQGALDAHINQDPLVASLTNSIVALQRQNVVDKLRLGPENPQIAENEAALQAFEEKLAEYRKEKAVEFDEIILERNKRSNASQIASLKIQAMNTRALEQKFRSMLTSQDKETRQMGRTNLYIQDLQLELDLERSVYHRVVERIKEMDMERKRQPQIELQSAAELGYYEDKRIQYAGGVAFGALACGCLLAFLVDKADKRLKHPEDVSQRIQLPLIGTVTSSRAVRPALFAEQIARDYQSLRTNLGLLSKEGIPRRLCVTSACPQEGKTTFAVNLATSLAKAGQRIMLIDGDLRKPDVTRVLDLSSISQQPSDSSTSQGGLDGSIWTIPSTGLDVLVPDGRHLTDPYELVASPLVGQHITIMSQKYDHIIIDTPPILAYPDGLIWAGLCGNAILICFAGQTLEPDLKEAKERLAHTNARVLGVVMNNVGVNRGYQRYGNGYYARASGMTRRSRRDAKRLLLSVESGGGRLGGEAERHGGV